MSQLEAIVAVFGGTLLDGGRRALIPGPNHSSRDRSVSLTECEDGRILIYCFSPRDDWRAVRDMLEAKKLIRNFVASNGSEPFKDSKAQAASADKLARALRIWKEARPIAWTAAELYLQGRAICGREGGDALRFHPGMTSLDDFNRRPALIAALLNPEGELQGVQATLLLPRGAGKARVATPRRVVGKLMGGAVRLCAANETLIIAEGVETALSASEHFFLPAWAALTAGNLERFVPPPCVRRLIIAADRDEAGRIGAERLQDRLGQSINVEITPPPNRFKDWNDFAKRAQVDASGA